MTHITNEMLTVGFIGTNKQGLRYEIVDAPRMKAIKIRFEDGVEVVTTSFCIKQGLPLHPTKFKMFPGDRHKDKDGLEFELVEKLENTSWRIRYTKDGVECNRDIKTIQDSKGRHPIDSFISVGEKFKVHSGLVTVKQYNSATNILVEFEDGSVVKTNSSCLRLGNVGHPTSGLTVGQALKTKSGWNYTIEKYISPYEVHVRMQDGSLEIVTATAAKHGGFKPCNQPSVAGVGFIGQGRFTNLVKKKGEKAPEVIFSYWRRMITRCYSETELMKIGGRQYLYTDVNKDWYNFQNFAEWALDQPNWNMGHDLDKDLLGDGLEYSSTKCTFLPLKINTFLAENYQKTVHNLPIGVQYIKPGTKGAKIGYVARCFVDDERKYLGYYEDPMEAHLVYRKAKESQSRILAEKFRTVITQQAYEALMNFKLISAYPTPIHRCSST